MQNALKHRARKDQLLRISHGVQQQAIDEFLFKEAAQRAVKLNADYHNWLNTWFRFHPPEIPAVRIHSDEVHETTEGTVVRVQQELAERKREQDLLRQQEDVERMIDYLTHGGHVKPSSKKPSASDYGAAGGGGGGGRGDDDDDDFFDFPGGGGGVEVKTEEDEGEENQRTQAQSEGQTGFANVQPPDHRAVEDPSQLSHALNELKQETVDLSEYVGRYGRLPAPLSEQATERDEEVMTAIDADVDTVDLGGEQAQQQAQAEGVVQEERGVQTTGDGDDVIPVPQELLERERELAIERRNNREANQRIVDLMIRMRELNQLKSQLEQELANRPLNEELRQSIEFLGNQLDKASAELQERQVRLTGLEQELARQQRVMQEELRATEERVSNTFRDSFTEQLALQAVNLQANHDMKVAGLQNQIRLLEETLMQKGQTSVTEQLRARREMERLKQELGNTAQESLGEHQQVILSLQEEIQRLRQQLANAITPDPNVAGPSTAVVTGSEEEARLKQKMNELMAVSVALQDNVRQLETDLRASRKESMLGVGQVQQAQKESQALQEQMEMLRAQLQEGSEREEAMKENRGSLLQRLRTGAFGRDRGLQEEARRLKEQVESVEQGNLQLRVELKDARLRNEQLMERINSSVVGRGPQQQTESAAIRRQRGELSFLQSSLRQAQETIGNLQLQLVNAGLQTRTAAEAAQQAIGAAELQQAAQPPVISDQALARSLRDTLEREMASRSELREAQRRLEELERERREAAAAASSKKRRFGKELDLNSKRFWDRSEE